MNAMSQSSTGLTITQVGEQHYQLTDTSVESIGLCLGVFHSREGAQRFADSIARRHTQNGANQNQAVGQNQVMGLAKMIADESTTNYGSKAKTHLAADWRKTLSLRDLMPQSRDAAPSGSI